jgi:ADP-glucose pyrophosphorylase
VRALKLMIDSPYPNALIDYDRSALEFPQERIEKFAVTLKDKKNYLIDILEKPSPADIEKARGKDGMIGVSMNIFRLDYDMILPCLEQVPEHPIREEKELPAAVIMMVNKHPKSCYAFPLKEHVPDLTQLTDVESVQKYLLKYFDIG